MTTIHHEPVEKTLHLPPNARFHPEERLLTWHPHGIFDDLLADQVVMLLESPAVMQTAPFHAFTDFSALTEIRLSVGHLFEIAERRQTASEPGKSAFYGETFAAIGICRMYEELMKEAAIQVRVFRARSEAAEWLGVPLGLLEPK
jgi:hypothetical protein